MPKFLFFAALIACFSSLAAAAIPQYNARAFTPLLNKRQDNSSLDALVVDLGYERYRGVANGTTGLNTWKGVRFAASVDGENRWQPPQAPSVNRDQVLPADALEQRCPQSPKSPFPTGLNITGNEDCLFLSVYAPQNKTNLPVLVWIHGGGYGQGQGNQDLSSIINTNNDAFIGVAIQYRLGAFGFLSSDEVMRYGAPNAGILDQTFALQWVQSYIHLFGGNASQVTISGESAGGGAVMLQTLAFGGYLSDSLFKNAIASSPYLPQQYGYADFVPSQSYYAFASAAGCFGPPALAQNNISNSIFQCLVAKDTETLQNASATISGSGRVGTWGFLPVTDGVYIQQLPSQQLLQKQLNGVNLLVGNNANEGPSFTPQNVLTEDDFVSFIQNTFPLFTTSDVSKTLLYYPSSDAAVDPAAPDFATAGNSTITALNESTYATGQQQRANNLYAETTFVCPAYWMAEAFTSPRIGGRGPGGKAFKYQYSIPGAQHGSDVAAIFGPPTPNQGPNFVRAIQTIWGNFVIRDDPSLDAVVVNGANSTSSNAQALAFPEFDLRTTLQVNLNETGGTPYSAANAVPGNMNVTQLRDPGLENALSIVDAYAWEGGRGRRCDFWRSVGKVVPE